MFAPMKIGIIREGKTPPDSRVALTPTLARQLASTIDFNVFYEPSTDRCYRNEEYDALGIAAIDDLSECDVLIGIKEVKIKDLIPNKTYLFFSHTVKMQAYNRELLQEIIAKGIRLIDYEMLTNTAGKRIIAFGHFAGIVGAYNGLWTYGERTGSYRLKRMHEYESFDEAVIAAKGVQLPSIRIVVTGTGRVASGAVQTLDAFGIKRVTPETYLKEGYDQAVYTQISAEDYMEKKDGGRFDRLNFYNYPHLYQSTFSRFARNSDLMINGIYYDSKSPKFFTSEEMCRPDFDIKVIADISCDIEPIASVPCTLRSTSISDPVFGYNPKTKQEEPPFGADVIDVMAIDNLPNELAREASTYFGQILVDLIIPELVKSQSDIIERATICRDGALTPQYNYLKDFVAAKL